MRKQNIFTVIGIALSFVIAVGGWWMTSELLDRKENDLLSVTGSVHVDTPTPLPIADEKNPDNYEEVIPVWPTLKETEIFNALINWEADGEERPHEPAEGQLNMEQAIDAGKAGLYYFSEQGIIPVGLLEYDVTNAYLCEKLPRGQDAQSLSPYYSYWFITFSSEKMSATLTLNAASGQIWKAKITLLSTDISFADIETEQMLDTFISYLKFDDAKPVRIDDTLSCKSIGDGSLFAIAQKSATNRAIGFFLSTKAR